MYVCACVSRLYDSAIVQVVVVCLQQFTSGRCRRGCNLQPRDTGGFVRNRLEWCGFDWIRRMNRLKEGRKEGHQTSVSTDRAVLPCPNSTIPAAKKIMEPRPVALFLSLHLVVCVWLLVSPLSLSLSLLSLSLIAFCAARVVVRFVRERVL